MSTGLNYCKEFREGPGCVFFGSDDVCKDQSSVALEIKTLKMYKKKVIFS